MSKTECERKHQSIAALLHGATCIAFRWDEINRIAELDFVVQRADKNGTLIERPITIRLNEVVQLAAYVCAPRMIPGMQIKPGELASRAQLKDWSNPSGVIHVDSRREQFEFENALQTDWILSTENGEPEHRIHYRSHGGDLMIGCQLISMHDDGKRLMLKEWSEQHMRWVESWKEYSDKDSTDSEFQPQNSGCEFDMMIPLVSEPENDGARVACPTAEIFSGDLDVPSELLRPIRDFHEGIHLRDWNRCAAAFPNLDSSTDSVADSYSREFRNGPWLYVRHIDDHWYQNGLGLVSVRGIEFKDDQIRETVVSYELRRLKDDWIIWNFSQGWVKPGSAPALGSRQIWHDEFEIPSHKPDNAKTIERVIKDEDDVSNPTIMLMLGVVALFVIVVMRYWLK